MSEETVINEKETSAAPVKRRRRPAKKKKSHKKLKKVLLITGIVLVSLALLVLLFRLLFPSAFSKVERYFRYFGVSDREGYGVITFDANSSNSYGCLDNNLLVGLGSGVTLYSEYGEELGSMQGSMPYPNVRVGGETAICFSSESNFFGIIDREGKKLLGETESGTVLDADVSPDDCACVLVAAEDYKAVASVMNARQQVIYRWSSSTMYLNCCAVSENAEYLAVVGLGQEESIFSSRLVLLDTQKTEPVASTALGNQVIYELMFLTKDRLCAIGETSALFLNTRGEITGEFVYDGLYLADYFKTADGRLVLEMNRSKAGNRMELHVFAPDGKKQADKYLGSETESVSVNGSYIAVLENGKITVYDPSLKIESEKSGDWNADRVLTRKDGSAYLIGNGVTEIYIP